MSSRNAVYASESPSREYPQRPIASAHALVFRGDRVLLVRRAHPPSQGRWSVPGGAIELGETIYDAARRELREECGVEIEVDKVLNVVDNIILDGTGRVRFHYIVIYLLARCAGGEARPSSDASEVLWAAREELEALDMHPLARRTTLHAFEAVDLRK